jgi:hypothetical protein
MENIPARITVSFVQHIREQAPEASWGGAIGKLVVENLPTR